MQMRDLCNKSNWIKSGRISVMAHDDLNIVPQLELVKVRAACFVSNAGDNRGSQASDRVTGLEASSRAQSVQCTLCRTLCEKM